MINILTRAVGYLNHFSKAMSRVRFRPPITWRYVSIFALTGWIGNMITVGLTISLLTGLVFLIFNGVDQLVTDHFSNKGYLFALWKDIWGILIPLIKYTSSTLMVWCGIVWFNHMADIMTMLPHGAMTIQCFTDLFSACMSFIYVVTWVPLTALVHGLYTQPWTVAVLTDLFTNNLFVHELTLLPHTVWALCKWPIGSIIADHVPGWLPDIISRNLIEGITSTVISALVIKLIMWYLFG